MKSNFEAVKDDLFLKHDLNLYNFVIRLNGQLREKNIVIKGKANLDLSMITPDQFKSTLDYDVVICDFQSLTDLPRANCILIHSYAKPLVEIAGQVDGHLPRPDNPSRPRGRDHLPHGDSEVVPHRHLDVGAASLVAALGRAAIGGARTEAGGHQDDA